MPQRKSGIKALRQTQDRRLHNLDIKTDLKKTVKSFQKAVDANDATEAKKLLSTVYKKIDKAAKRNILKDNTASRRKALFAKSLVKLQAS